MNDECLREETLKPTSLTFFIVQKIADCLQLSGQALQQQICSELKKQTV